MKKILVVMMVAMMLVWGVGVEKASAGTMNPVSFIFTSPSNVTTNIVTITGGCSLFVKFNSGTWSEINLANAPHFDFTLVYAGDTMWLGVGPANATAPGCVAGDVTIVGDTATVAFNVNTGCDAGCSATSFTFSCAGIETNNVPIPAAAWLLGSGLLGLIGVRRRSKK